MPSGRTRFYFTFGIILAICNVDWVIIPFILEPLLDSKWAIYVLAAPIATVEIPLWYKFWRWFFTEWLAERKKVKDTVEFGKEVIKDMKRKGILHRIIDYFETTFHWASNPNSWMIRSIKFFGHFGMIILGSEPVFSGGRLVGVIFCATTEWKKGLISLCIGNAIHVYISIILWKAGFHVWDIIFTQ